MYSPIYSGMDQFVGFTATATSDTEVPGRIEFNHVITNVGDGYDPDSSEFVCPRSGVYMFSVTVASSRPFHATVAIIQVYI